MTERSTVSRNPISIAGAWLTTLSALAFLTFFVMEWLDLIQGPYAGLLGFVLIPAIFVVGLLMIPLGIWREGRRRRLGKEPWAWPAVDLGRRRTRNVVGAIFLLTIVNIAIVATATVGALHYMETTGFCGQVCHTPMKPEFTAHAAAPHAGVACVACHVGPGARGLIQSKMNGARQMFELFTNSYSRPIPVPARNMPSAAGTCVRCHSIDQMPAERTIVKREYDEDETNTETASTIVMHTKAAHWHARPDVNVEFIAADAARATIPYVQLTSAGQTTEYLGEGVTGAAGRRAQANGLHGLPQPAGAHDGPFGGGGCQSGNRGRLVEQRVAVRPKRGRCRAEGGLSERRRGRPGAQKADERSVRGHETGGARHCGRRCARSALSDQRLSRHEGHVGHLRVLSRARGSLRVLPLSR